MVYKYRKNIASIIDQRIISFILIVVITWTIFVKSLSIISLIFSIVSLVIGGILMCTLYTKQMIRMTGVVIWYFLIANIIGILYLKTGREGLVYFVFIVNSLIYAMIYSVFLLFLIGIKNVMKSRKGFLLLFITLLVFTPLMGAIYLLITNSFS
jgi:hypothetical protein